ncbi:OsmC family peroxiredoxin [Sphingobacterium puteale]|uniref:OsmC family peroxiredoxin n=1 Tax=Sphingobacterium puteale TaxID=2420510 RepID=A0A420VX38_9SPHI|nr:OsmC family protein [Sphingobacterium puteale]RKO70797.1 OsmC family peroxiredoxin [Sphingobacterium puteale]
MKYILENPVSGHIGQQKYKTTIHWRNGELITDEPEKLGGKDLGPDPYTLLVSSLVSCTLATLRMYIDRKELHIDEIQVTANLYLRIEKEQVVTYFDREISFGQAIEENTVLRLRQIADECPISKILKGNSVVNTIMKTNN